MTEAFYILDCSNTVIAIMIVAKTACADYMNLIVRIVGEKQGKRQMIGVQIGIPHPTT